MRRASVRFYDFLIRKLICRRIVAHHKLTLLDKNQTEPGRSKALVAARRFNISTLTMSRLWDGMNVEGVKLAQRREWRAGVRAALVNAKRLTKKL